MFSILCIVLLVFEIGKNDHDIETFYKIKIFVSATVSAGCNLGMADAAIAAQIKCDKQSLKSNWFDKSKTCNMEIDSKIQSCFNSCGTCGQTVCCIKNELRLLNGMSFNCNVIQGILSKCSCCSSKYKQAFIDFYNMCIQKGGKAKDTVDGLNKATLEVLGPFALYFVPFM